MNKKHQITCYFTDTQMDWIKRQSTNQNRSINKIICMVIDDFIQMTKETKQKS